ncbi:MAG: hypothetical protein WD607_10290 [Candidatus Paceibacterota bacterium]
MEPATWGLIGTLFGAIIGAGASIITSVITSQNQVQLQKNRASLVRKERARAFQRETLLEIQDALNDLLRQNGQAYLIHRKNYKSEGKWGQSYLPDDLDENIRLANSKFVALVERISDDSLRSDLKELRSNLNRMLFAMSAEEAQDIFHNTGNSAIHVMEKLGVVLRNQY